MIICKTPLRVSFLGGGTDWPEFFSEGRGAVLGTAIDRCLYHSVTPLYSALFDYCIRLAYRKVECVRSLDEIEHKPFREILRFLGVERDIEVSLAAELPSFCGLGSSSTFTVGLLNSLRAHRGQFTSQLELARMAIHVEQAILREAVGCQDQIFAAFGGFNIIEFHSDGEFAVHRVCMNRARQEELDRSLLMYFTGETRSAQVVEADKFRRLEENRHRLANLLAMVDRGHDLLTGSAPLGRFGELLDESWGEKRGLSPLVSTPQVDAMYNRARELGALGGKLLGAGGGGFLLLFVPPERQDAFRVAFRDHLEIEFHINAPGSCIVHS